MFRERCSNRSRMLDFLYVLKWDVSNAEFQVSTTSSKDNEVHHRNISQIAVFLHFHVAQPCCGSRSSSTSMWLSTFSAARFLRVRVGGYMRLCSSNPMHTLRCSLVLAAFMAGWGEIGRSYPQRYVESSFFDDV